VVTETKEEEARRLKMERLEREANEEVTLQYLFPPLGGLGWRAWRDCRENNEEVTLQYLFPPLGGLGWRAWRNWRDRPMKREH
jgi:hypothetical protein